MRRSSTRGLVPNFLQLMVRLALVDLMIFQCHPYLIPFLHRFTTCHTQDLCHRGGPAAGRELLAPAAVSASIPDRLWLAGH